MPTHKQRSATRAKGPESDAELAQLTAELYERFHPADVTERFLVDTLVHNQWRLRRLRRMEAVYFEHLAETAVDPNKNLDPTFATAFERVQRLVDNCERSSHRALKELAARAQTRRIPRRKSPGQKSSDAFEAFDASFQSILKQ